MISMVRRFSQRTNSAMNLSLRVFLLFVCCIAVQFSAYAQFPPACDADKSCLGRAYTSTRGSGRGAHYVDIQNVAIQDRLTTAMTFEFWMKVSRPGLTGGGAMYIGGLWGPSTNTDNNDSWVLYINQNDELVFEVNGNGTVNGAGDNTSCRASIANRFGQWTHIAAIFDGATRSVRLVINGAIVASGTNTQFPVTQLRKPENRGLLTQIGSSNAISDRSSNLTFVGQLDEIRIWNRVVPESDLYCNSTRSLNGNEAGLVIYYRCNEPTSNLTTLCDATGNGFAGSLRSGASCTNSDRSIQQKLIKNIPSINETLQCVTTKTWQVTVTDTSICGSTANLSIGGADARFFRVSQNSLTLSPQTPVTYNVTFTGNITGTITAFIRMVGTNRCTVADTLRISLNRITELSVNKRAQRFDTLYAGCPTKRFIDSTIQICNNSGATGTNTNRPLTITGGRFTSSPTAFSILPPAGKSFPFTLAVGECANITVRFTPLADTTFRHIDTLIITSDDACQGSGYVVLTADIVEVFRILNAGGTAKLPPLTFPATCPNDLSNPREFLWRNMTLRDIFIDDIIIPPTIAPVRVPRIPAGGWRVEPFLRASAANLQSKYLRFRPLVPGVINDTVKFIVRLPGETCKFIISIPFTGRGRDNKVEFTIDTVRFGNVVVGKERTLPVTFRNTSTTDNLNVTFTLKIGDAFYFTGAKSANLAPGTSTTINITFRPTDSLDYTDALFLFETNCFKNDSLWLRGKGIIENFRFDPLVMRTLNIIGCKDSMDFVDIINESSTGQTLTQLRLDDPSGYFSVVDQNGNPTALPGSVSLPSKNSKQRFYFKFRPPGLGNDVATRAYLRYKSSSGDDWMVQLYATSVSPRLYITPLTQFGTREVGDTQREIITIENISPIDVYAEKLVIPNGFNLIQYVGGKTLPRWMKPRDSIQVEVEFAPNAQGTYDNTITVSGEQPCPNIVSNGTFKARSNIVRLDVPRDFLNYSYVRPCDCKLDTIALINQSLVHPMKVDSLFIDTVGMRNGTPTLFRIVGSTYYDQNGKQFPYNIPPSKEDNLIVAYCPRTTAEPTRVNSSAYINIRAGGVGWGDTLFRRTLVGRRTLLFTPNPALLAFPPTRVDTLSPVRNDTLRIPDFSFNPDQESITIDSITYIPDDRVFIHKDSAGNDINFPVTLQPGKAPTRFRFFFKPRAPRQGAQQYRARAVIHYSKPCLDQDTTILLTGEGFAQPFGLNITFENNKTVLDTFRINTCDTVVVPLYSSRQMPARSINITNRLGYDTTKLKFVSASSPYTPTPTFAPSPFGGTDITIKNAIDVDSINPFVVARLVPKQPIRQQVPISVDSLFFDTDEVLNFKIIAGTDKGLVIVDQPEIKITSDSIDYGMVRILDCSAQSFYVKNIGDVALTVDSLLSKLPSTFTIANVVPPKGTLIPIGDSVQVTVDFCPRNTDSLRDTMQMYSISPCLLADTITVTGQGFAPRFDVLFSTDVNNFTNPSSIVGQIGDTIVVPIYVDKDFYTTYRSQLYWLRDISFGLRVSWNPFMLKYIGSSSVFGSKFKATPDIISAVNLSYSDLDSLRGGKIVDLKFVVTVPDTINDRITITPSIFTSDSLMFLDINPYLKPSVTGIDCGGKCNTTFLRYNATRPQLYQSAPNPSNEIATIRFDIQETVPAVITLYSSSGEVVKEILNTSVALQGGQHSVSFMVNDLPSGVYYYTLRAGIFTETMPLTIVK